MGIKEVLGFLGAVLNISLQLSPMPGIIEGYKKMEVKNLTISYFVVGISQGVLWIGYGLNISDIVVYGPNITIYILFSIYLNVLIFIKSRYNLFYLTNIPLAILCIISCKIFPEIINVSGATIISICWQTTNVETMRLALKNYDPAYINILVSLVTFSCFVCMALYSLLIEAYIMFIPYFYGAILNFTNIYIYYWACRKMPKDDCFIRLLFSILKPGQETEGEQDKNFIQNSQQYLNEMNEKNIVN